LILPCSKLLIQVVFQFVKHVSCVTLRPTSTVPSVMCRSIKQDHFRIYGLTRHYRTLSTSLCLAYFKVSNESVAIWNPVVYCSVECCNLYMHLIWLWWSSVYFIYFTHLPSRWLLHVLVNGDIWELPPNCSAAQMGKDRCFFCHIRLHGQLGVDLIHQELIHIAIYFHYFPNKSMSGYSEVDLSGMCNRLL
jgi:hypothetical protein